MDNNYITNNITVITQLKSFEQVEFCLLNNNVQNIQNMILSGYIAFTLKPKSENELKHLFNEVCGVPQRSVFVTLKFPDETIKELPLKILCCDDEITNNFLTMVAEKWS